MWIPPLICSYDDSFDHFQSHGLHAYAQLVFFAMVQVSEHDLEICKRSQDTISSMASLYGKLLINHGHVILEIIVCSEFSDLHAYTKPIPFL